MRREHDNPFEQKQVAEQWIAAVESELGGARENEVYPRLKDWVVKNDLKSVLEVGAGQGICSVQVQGIKYVGVEPSAFLVKRARQLYEAADREFVEGSVYSLDFEEASFDAVFSVGVWFHLDDLDRAHSEIRKVLKENGRVLIVTSNPDMHHVWETVVVGEKEGKKLMGEALLPTGRLSKNIFYLHTEAEIISSLEKHSFTVVDIQKFGSGSGNVEKGVEQVWMSIEAIKKESPDEVRRPVERGFETMMQLE